VIEQVLSDVSRVIHDADTSERRQIAGQIVSAVYSAMHGLHSATVARWDTPGATLAGKLHTFKWYGNEMDLQRAGVRDAEGHMVIFPTGAKALKEIVHGGKLPDGVDVSVTYLGTFDKKGKPVSGGGMKHYAFSFRTTSGNVPVDAIVETWGADGALVLTDGGLARIQLDEDGNTVTQLR